MPSTGDPELRTVPEIVSWDKALVENARETSKTASIPIPLATEMAVCLAMATLGWFGESEETEQQAGKRNERCTNTLLKQELITFPGDSIVIVPGQKFDKLRARRAQAK